MRKGEMFPRLMWRREKLKRNLFIDAVGICRECFEVTEVLHPCCDGEVEYHGIILGRDDFEGEMQNKNSA